MIQVIIILWNLLYIMFSSTSASRLGVSLQDFTFFGQLFCSNYLESSLMLCLFFGLLTIEVPFCYCNNHFYFMWFSLFFNLHFTLPKYSFVAFGTPHDMFLSFVTVAINLLIAWSSETSACKRSPHWPKVTPTETLRRSSQRGD